ncbi:serine/threonine-protein kinase nrc-2 [Acrasis kona]|uniref:non-specific serine/threonine protein kinase n=1 Tax=Acrasis kona TaxID=1008807 RepID=A0AAW2ZD19_9EUKA
MSSLLVDITMARKPKPQHIQLPTHMSRKHSPGTAELTSATVNMKGLPNFDKLSPHHFEKVRLLGRGDVGKVYLVHLRGAPKDSQYYAMKVLEKQDMINRKKVQRCLTEREILSSSRHPFIVTMYASFQDEDKLYMLMEYCAGGELFRVLQTQPNKCLCESSVRFFIAEVLLALEYLHKVGVVYRDLKPENVLLHESGHIRLTDFDLSKRTSITNLDDHSTTRSRPWLFPLFAKKAITRAHHCQSFVGTAEYISPEIINGTGYGPCVDWWTLGILLYEMIYAKTPYRGENNDETFNKVLHGKLNIPVNSCHGPVSKNCRNLIKKLLHVDMNKRLGHKHGAKDIKDHAFFKGVNWDALQTQVAQAPIVKGEIDYTDFTNFQQDLVDSDDENDDRDVIPEIGVEGVMPEMDQRSKLFKNFVYTPKTPTPTRTKGSPSQAIA